MKKLFFLVSVLFIISLVIAKPVRHSAPTGLIVKDTVSHWDIFVQALVMTESGNDSLAMGPTNDAGILQLTPIYVQEVNRIGGTSYSLDDRFNVRKSMEMFNIMNSHYNPQFNVSKAIKIHNPGAGSWYSSKVYGYMTKITSYYQAGEKHNGSRILNSEIQDDGDVILTMLKIKPINNETYEYR